MASTRLPSASERNSPLALSSFRAFHWRGLCEAVMMMPPSAFFVMTAISVPGVVQSPTLMTSAPQASRVPSTRLETISPEMRASRPMTITSFLPGLRSAIRRT